MSAVKKIYTATLCLVVLLTFAGCTPQEVPATASTTQQQSTSAASAVSARQNASEAAPSGDLVFSYTGQDPQAGDAYDSGTLTVTGLLNKAGSGYTGEVSIRRSLQTGDKATVREDSVTQEVWYDSVNFVTEQPSQSGNLRMLTYSWMNAGTTSNYFDLPFRLTLRSGGAEEVAYTLQTQGSNALLTLCLQDGTEISVTGKPGTLPAQSPPAATNLSRLLVSDFGYSTNDLTDRDVYRVLCSAVREGETYHADIRLYRIREKCGAAGCYSSAAQGESWEGEAKFELIPFAEKAYREAGGKMGRQLIASAAQMAMTEANGHPLILTVSGERVYLELPGEAFPGYFVGKMDARSDAARIAEEETVLWQRDYLFRTTPQAGSDLNAGDMAAGAAAAGMVISEEELAVLEEYMQGLDNVLEGQSLWLPEHFLPMPNGKDFGEMPLIGNGAGTFGFTMEGKWLDEMIPAYQAHLKGMRNFVFQEGEYAYGHYGATFQFDYGECHVSLDMNLIPYVGTGVDLEFCRSN